jgi:hypothetical protein
MGINLNKNWSLNFTNPLTMSAGETIKVESPMGFYHSPTGVLLPHMGFYPHSIKMGDKGISHYFIIS